MEQGRTFALYLKHCAMYFWGLETMQRQDVRANEIKRQPIPNLASAIQDAPEAGIAHQDAAVAAPPSPLRSALHVPLATDNRIVGLTYLAAFRPDAFSRQDEEVLAALATRSRCTEALMPPFAACSRTSAGRPSGATSA